MLITCFHPVLRVGMRQLYLRCALGFKDVVPNKTQGKIYPHYIHLKIFVRKDAQVHFDIYFITFGNLILWPLSRRCGSVAARCVGPRVHILLRARCLSFVIVVFCQVEVYVTG